MDVVEDSAKREALAQRMSKLLGLPITNIQLLMPLISKDDLQKLESLPDDQFLSQATKIINAAQKRQFEDKGSTPTASTQKTALDVNAGTTEPAAPAAEAEPAPRKKLGRKSAKEEAPSDTPGTAKQDRNVADSDDGAADMPSVFHKPQKKESMFSDKRLVMLLGVGGVGAVIFVCLLGLLIYMLFIRTPDDSNNMVELPPAEVVVVEEVVIEYPHTSGLKLNSTFDLSVGLEPNLTGAVTAEVWIKPLEAMGTQDVMILGEGDEETFRLMLRRQEDGSFMAEFAVPPAGRETASFQIGPEAASQWIHLAGVYDPVNTQRIYLFVGGTRIADAPTTDLPDMMSSTYRVLSTMNGEGEGMILDEIRITNAPLYTTDFSPARVLEPLSDSLSLLHLESWEDGQIMDAGRQDLKLAISGGQIVSIADEMSAPAVYAITLAPIPFPPELVDPLTEQMGKYFVEKFLKEWEQRDRAGRLKYLQRIKYPSDRIAMGISSVPKAEPPSTLPDDEME